MELIDLKSLNLTTEESGHIIKFLARRRGITTKKLLSTIKLNLKRKNNKDLASKSQQKLVKKTTRISGKTISINKITAEINKSIKSQQKLTKQTKSQRELIKSQRKSERLIKPKQRIELHNIENNNNDDFIENVRDLFNIKNENDDFMEKIDTIRKKLNEVRHNLPKSELKEIKKYLYNIEKNKLLEKNKAYLGELNKKIIKLNEYNNVDFIENVRDLFNIVNYEPILIKTDFDKNYLVYRSEGNDSLSFEEYLNLRKPYLNDLINGKKDKGE